MDALMDAIKSINCQQRNASIPSYGQFISSKKCNNVGADNQALFSTKVKE